MQNHENEFVQRRRSLLLKISCVFLISCILICFLCTLSVSAAEYEYTYTTYTYSDFGSDAIINFDLDGGYQVEGEWKYDRVSGAFPNHFIFEFQNDVAPVGRPITFYIAAFIDDTYAPGSYTMEFDISIRNLCFKGWDQIPMTSAEYPDPYDPLWVDVDNPALTFGPTYVNNNGSISWNANVFSTFGISSESANTPSLGFTNYKFFTSFTIDKARQFDDIIIRIPYDFTGNAQDWASGSMSMFMSDIVVKSYTDDLAAVDQYTPPIIDGYDQYENVVGDLDNFTANQQSTLNSYFDFDLGSTQGLAQGLLLVSHVLDKYVFSLEPITILLYISAGVGIIGVILGLGGVFGSIRSSSDRQYEARARKAHVSRMQSDLRRYGYNDNPTVTNKRRR